MYKVPQTEEEISAHIGALRGLVSQGGWKLFEAFCEAEEQRFIAAFAATKDGHQLALLAASVKTLREMRTWPARQAGFLVDHLKAAADGNL